MKKFFKALALVLALTLVIGTIPAAAADAKITAVEKKTLYVGGSKGVDNTGKQSTYKAKVTYAKLLGITKKEAKKLKVTAVSTNSDIVAVNNKTRRVRAYGIGTETVTLKANGKTYDVVITAKKSADEVVFGRDWANVADLNYAVEAELDKEYTVSVPQSKAGVKIDTDERRLVADDDSVIITPVEGKKRLYTVKFTKAGEFTVTGEAFQSAKSYPGATATQSVKVTIAAADFAAKATKAKEITVTGNGFTKDSTFAVKRGTLAIDVASVTVSEDGTTAVLAIKTKIGDGTYTVTCGDKSATFQGEDERVEAIIVKEAEEGKDLTTANDGKLIYVHYDVLNQYAESVRSSYSVSWQSTYGGTPDTDKKDIGLLSFSDKDAINYGQQVVITGVYTGANGGKSVNATLKVGLANHVGKVDVKKIVDISTKETFDSVPAGFVDGRYAIYFQMLDRNGFEMEYSDEEASNLSIISTSPLLASIIDNAPVKKKSIKIDSVEYPYALIEGGNNFEEGGIANIEFISGSTGDKTPYELKIDSAQVLDKFEILSPDFVIAEGEEVTLSYVATDTNGKEITQFSALVNSLTLSGKTKLYMREKNDGTAELRFKAPDDIASDKVDGTVVLTAIVIGTGSASTVTLKVKDKAYAYAIRDIEKRDALALVERGQQRIYLRDADGWSTNYLLYYDKYDRARAEYEDPFNGYNIENDVYVAVLYDTSNTDTDKLSVSTKNNNQDKIGDNLVYYLDDSAWTKTIDSVGKNKDADYFTITAKAGAANGKVTEADVTFAMIKKNKDGKFELISGSKKTFTYKIAAIGAVTSFAVNVDNSEQADGAEIKNSARTGIPNYTGITGKLSDGTTVYVPSYYVRYDVANNANISPATLLGGASVVTGGSVITIKPTFGTTLKSGADTTASAWTNVSTKNADGSYPANSVAVKISAKVYNVSGGALDTVSNPLGQPYSIVKFWNNTKNTEGYYEMKVNKFGLRTDYYRVVDTDATNATAVIRPDTGKIDSDTLRTVLGDGSNTYNQYVGKDTYNKKANIEITNYKEVASGRYDDATNKKAAAVMNNNSDKAYIENAEIGDTFEATFTYEKAKITVKFTVGSDITAEFVSASDVVSWY